MRRYEFYSTRSSLFVRIMLFLVSIFKSVWPFFVWAIVSLLYGLFVGLAAVVLPPTAVFGLVAIAAIILLWAMPELPVIPLGLSRNIFITMIIVDLCVPAYYAISLPGLPWISARRVFIFSFIILFAIICGGSSSVRRVIASVFTSNKPIFFCIIGYIFMSFVSIFTSISPSTSFAVLADSILSWYLPALGAVLFLQSKSQIVFFMKIICCCCLFVTIGGVVSFLIHRNVFLALLPSWIVDAMLQNSPAFERMISGGVSDRNGMYRSESIFGVSLSFAEFEAMILCIGYFFILDKGTIYSKLIGFLTVASVGIGVFVSGSRGGYMASIVGSAAFCAIMIARSLRFGGRSLVPGIVLSTALIGFALLLTAVFTVPAVHNRVLGGGADRYSDEARIEQWELGIPKIQSNPITGHGLGMGGVVVGYHADTPNPTIDSYVLSILVETGVPGLVFFVGIVVFGVITGLKIALIDGGSSGVMASALAGSIAAFGFYRIALSQLENFTLFFLIVALVMNLNTQIKKEVTSTAVARTA